MNDEQTDMTGGTCRLFHDIRSTILLGHSGDNKNIQHIR